MAKDSYLIELYNKVKGVSKANFNGYITDTQSSNKNFSNSLNNFKNAVTSNNWSDDIETLVELTNDEVKKYTNYVQNYLDTVVIPLSSKTEELEVRLKKYVNEESKEEVVDTTPVADTYFEDAFSDIDTWIKDPTTFRTRVDDYYTPKDEYLNQGTGVIDKMIDDALYAAMQDYNNDKKTTEIISNLKEKIDPYFNRSKATVVETTPQANTSVSNEIDLETYRKECYETIKDIHKLLGDLEAVAKTESKIAEISSTIATLKSKITVTTTGSSTSGGGNTATSTAYGGVIGAAIAGASLSGASGNGANGGNGSGNGGTGAGGVDTPVDNNDQLTTGGTKIHFFKLIASDSILVESKDEYGLIDASNPSSGAMANGTSNGTVVLNSLRSAGVKHLKFLLISHCHSDHVGGMTEIINSELVDNTTTLIYKKAIYDDTQYGEVVYNIGADNDYIDAPENWYSKDLLDKAVNAMSSKGGILLETDSHNAANMTALGATFVPGADKWLNAITFKLGDLFFKIYNLPLYTFTDNGRTLYPINSNSLVTLITSASGKRILLSGDLDVRDTFEQYYAKIIGKVDVFKADHHGHPYSNSRGLLSRLLPTYMIVPNSLSGAQTNTGINAPFLYVKKNGGTVYFTGDGPIDIDLTTGLTVTGLPSSYIPSDGWASWTDEDSKRKWTYIKNFTFLTGWQELDGSWFYFDSNGIMLDGWQELEWEGVKDWYYFDETPNSSTHGVMTSNRWQEYNGKWYYLGSNGKMLKSTSLRIGNKLYKFNGTGVCTNR